MFVEHALRSKLWLEIKHFKILTTVQLTFPAQLFQ